MSQLQQHKTVGGSETPLSVDSILHEVSNEEPRGGGVVHGGGRANNQNPEDKDVEMELSLLYN